MYKPHGNHKPITYNIKSQGRTREERNKEGLQNN